MATITVSSSAALTNALKAAHAGDTILLAAGNYASVTINNFRSSGLITISSASTANPATIASLNITNSSGLKFTNITFATALTNATTSTYAPFPFQVTNSSSITFDHINVHGTLDGNADNDVSGFYVKGSSGVSFTNSTFQQLFSAIANVNDTNVVISNNVIHDIRTDGIDNGGVSNVVISGNQFSNFFPIGSPDTGGDHPDAIQFYTQNTTNPASNIIIQNNSYSRGSGLAAQGIFITDQVGFQYNNITISGNSIVGGMGNGIDVSSATNVKLTNNSVVGYNDLGSTIRLENNTNVTYNNNISTGSYIVNTAFLSQLANQMAGTINPLQSKVDLSSHVTVVAAVATLDEYSSVVGNALKGDTGTNLYLADIGVGAGYQKVLPAGGATLTGTYGTLTIQSNGAFSHAETKNGLTVGQTYDDHFTLTVANTSGSVQTTTLDILTKPSGMGTANADLLIGGAGAETITGLGGADHISSGTGPDTFAYTSVNDSTATNHDTITGFKAGDIIDLTAVDPNFQIVSKFDHHAHELMIINNGNGSWDIYGDTTGSGTANFQIHFTGATAALSAANIHL